MEAISYELLEKNIADQEERQNQIGDVRGRWFKLTPNTHDCIKIRNTRRVARLSVFSAHSDGDVTDRFGIDVKGVARAA